MVPKPFRGETQGGVWSGTGVWLLTHYVLYVWDNVHVKDSDVRLEQFFGYLTFKFKESPTQLDDHNKTI